MPIAGPRDQHGQLPGYRNPDFEAPDRFNLWKRPGPIYWPGRSPGMMVVTLRGCILAAGQIRQLWRQSINLVSAQDSFSWTANGLGADGMPNQVHGFAITRALRYMTRSLYVAGGTDNSRYAALHTVIRKENFHKTITIGGGQVRGRPTVRNRLTSFGSRVPTLNQAVAAAEGQQPGRATQA
jgi:hypothetical protein